MNISQHALTTLVLGIDGGGTKTAAWLATCDDAALHIGKTVVGRGFAGPSNQRAVGPVTALNNLDAAVEAAFADAGLRRGTVAAACLGLAGADRDTDRRVVEDWARDSRLACAVEVVNDAVPLLSADQGDGCGVALIAGTGSLAWGRNAVGETARSGGWGYLCSDEGSAFAIGRAVLQGVSRALDGRGAQTCLVAEVVEFLQLSSPWQIVTAVYGHEVPRSIVSSLSPLAFAAASTGDLIATVICQQAATELAEMVVATAQRLALQSALSLSLTGAVLLQNPEFRQQVLSRIVGADVSLVRTTIVEDAVAGAVNIACRLARNQDRE